MWSDSSFRKINGSQWWIVEKRGKKSIQTGDSCGKPGKKRDSLKEGCAGLGHRGPRCDQEERLPCWRGAGRTGGILP